MKQAITIAVGTAAGIGLFIAVVAVGNSVKNTVHSIAQGRVSDAYKAKANVSIETYEKLLAMNPENPNFQKKVDDFETQEMGDPIAETEAEQGIQDRLISLQVSQRIRPTLSEKYCKPGNKEKAGVCDVYMEKDKTDAETNSIELNYIKMMTGFQEGGR